MQTTLEVIEKNGLGVAFVIDDYEKLLGVITDGDIRRSILSGKSVRSSVSTFMNKNFKALLDTATNEETLKYMDCYDLEHLPLIDEKGRLVDLKIRENKKPIYELDNRVIIMAGGKGTRLRPYTERCPKPMVCIGDKPILELIIYTCRNQGLRKITISVNYMKEKIIDYFRDGSDWGVEIEYIEEGKELGTAGSLSLLKERDNLPIVVINGDVLCNLNLRQLLKSHVESGSGATMCVKTYEVQIPYGVVDVKDGKLISITEKPRYLHFVNAGIYVLNSDIIMKRTKVERIDMPTILESIMDKVPVSVYPFSDYWIDVGDPDALAQARQEYSY
ncbi:D-glycero-alpha-D-manno-heptose 1-phosphate guanylyltransferase [Prochlorococcus marinus str. MIT 1313]|nr:D-glycero-alpha-D-manno-heptose 1-phosphate guanylyltransferase [Prochlorococcus marinus str. MIT 1313]KZR72329.1 D-glycero-alpha-D-manno-heptose 1-phosphate guanylyltransferase [Prochlorococcus marinus str. MIT 1318]